MKLGTIRPTTKPSGELSMGPLIDIVFILLIFFVVTTTFKKSQVFAVERPSASQGVAGSADTVEVVVDHSGRIAVAGKRVSSWAISTSLRAELLTRTNKDVVVVSDAMVSTQELMSVLDACKEGGATAIALSVQPE